MQKKKSGNTYRKGKKLKLTKVDNPVCNNSSKAEKGLHWQESSSFVFLGKTNGKSLTGICKCCILLNSEISDNKARERETKGLNFTEFAIWNCHHSKAYIDSRKYTRGQDLGEYKQEGISIQKTLVCGNKAIQAFSREKSESVTQNRLTRAVSSLGSMLKSDMTTKTIPTNLGVAA